MVGPSKGSSLPAVEASRTGAKSYARFIPMIFPLFSWRWCFFDLEMLCERSGTLFWYQPINAYLGQKFQPQLLNLERPARVRAAGLS
jgi:hypothetical protein